MGKETKLWTAAYGTWYARCILIAVKMCCSIFWKGGSMDGTEIFAVSDSVWAEPRAYGPKQGICP